MINISNIQKAYFSFDGGKEFYEGYHNPNKLWNGWAMPCFEKGIADIIKKRQNQRKDHIYYRELDDYYVNIHLLNHKEDIFDTIILDTPDGKKKLYQIGAGYWKWNYYSLEEAISLNKDADIISLDKNLSIIKKAYFNIDGQNEYYEGYHNPKKLWNGWAMPYFEKKIVDAMIENFKQYEGDMKYDEKNDYYVYTYPDGEKDIFDSYTLDTTYGRKKLYAIGSACWIWDSYRLEEIKKWLDPEIVSLNEDKDIVKIKYDNIDIEY